MKMLDMFRRVAILSVVAGILFASVVNEANAAGGLGPNGGGGAGGSGICVAFGTTSGTCREGNNAAPPGTGIFITADKVVTTTEWSAFETIGVNAASKTITLPAASTLQANGGGLVISTLNAVTLAIDAADNINGGTNGASLVLAANQNVVVTLDPTGGHKIIALNATVGGGGSGQSYVKILSGNYYWPQNTSLAASATPTIGRTYFISTYIPGTFSISELGMAITTIGAAGNFQVSVYATDATTGMPTGAPLATTPSISTGSLFAASGTLATPLAVTPGFYWFAIMVDNNTVRYNAISGVSVSNSIAQGSNISGMGVANQTYIGPTVTFGSWPTMNGTICGTGNCTSVSGSNSTSITPFPFYRVQ